MKEPRVMLARTTVVSRYGCLGIVGGGQCIASRPGIAADQEWLSPVELTGRVRT